MNKNPEPVPKNIRRFCDFYLNIPLAAKSPTIQNPVTLVVLRTTPPVAHEMAGNPKDISEDFISARNVSCIKFSPGFSLKPRKFGRT
jgi:hypothetical protein